jgi:hypothetical protein
VRFILGDVDYKHPVAAHLRLPPKNVSVELSDVGAIHVIGSPGEGKSTFLGRLADGGIESGEGVLLIDPKGDLAVDVASRTAYPEDLIYITPGAYSDKYFTLNVMEVSDNPKLRDIVAGNVVKMFEHLGKYDAAFMTLVGKYLVACVQTAYAKPDPTLVDVIKIMLIDTFRAEMVAKTRRPDLKIFWEYYEKRTGPEQRSQIDSTLGRLWEFLNFETSYWTIASPTSTLKLADWLNEGKLVVVNLAQGLDEGDARRLGNLMVSYLTTQYRLRESGLVPWDRSRRWRLIVDEFQEFSPIPFAQIIRNGRAFNFFTVVAHQDSAQLNDYPQLKGAVGHAARLEFRRSIDDIPTRSFTAQDEYRAGQDALRKFEADWTFRSPTGTTTTRVRMADWKAVAKPEQLGLAVDQAIQHTLPKSQIPSLSEDYRAWRQGGTMGSNAKSTKAAGKNQVPPARQNLPDEPNPTWRGDPGAARPTGLLDLFPSGQDLLLGRDAEQRPAPPPLSRAESGQRHVPEKAQGPRVRGGGAHRPQDQSDQPGTGGVEPVDEKGSGLPQGPPPKHRQ